MYALIKMYIRFTRLKSISYDNVPVLLHVKVTVLVAVCDAVPLALYFTAVAVALAVEPDLDALFLLIFHALLDELAETDEFVHVADEPV